MRKIKLLKLNKVIEIKKPLHKILTVKYNSEKDSKYVELNDVVNNLKLSYYIDNDDTQVEKIEEYYEIYKIKTSNPTSENIVSAKTEYEAAKQIENQIGISLSKNIESIEKLGKSYFEDMLVYHELYTNRGEAVMQLSLEGEFINQFKSQTEAARQVNAHASGISAVCAGKRKTAGGYKWAKIQ